MIIRLLLAALVVLSVWAGAQLYAVETERRELRDDAVELSKIKYGIFNVDEWKRIVTRVISEKIEEFDLSEGDRKDMRIKINAFLTEVISELKDRFRQENKKGLMGFLKREGATFFGIFDQMERDIPVFTDQIVTFFDDPQNRAEAKAYLTEKVNDYADNTFSETDYTVHDEILERHGYADRRKAVAAFDARSRELELKKRPYELIVYAVLAALMAYLFFVKKVGKWEVTLITAVSAMALFLGVMLPMIEIDARIAKLAFSLLGEPVVFTDQVLYFKSKSILEVVELMVMQGKADLLGVGFLVLAFSVLFPLAKITASVFFLHMTRLRKSKVIRFLVFKTGKWSMADVMVVAIFMSYIGFSGIVSEQLGQLEGIARHADVLTTNNSRLQTGFFMFAGFVVLSLGVAQRMSTMEDVSAAEAPSAHR